MPPAQNRHLLPGPHGCGGRPQNAGSCLRSPWHPLPASHGCGSRPRPLRHLAWDERLASPLGEQPRLPEHARQRRAAGTITSPGTALPARGLMNSRCLPGGIRRLSARERAPVFLSTKNSPIRKRVRRRCAKGGKNQEKGRCYPLSRENQVSAYRHLGQTKV